MRKLMLLRHAKAANGAALDDKDRPLNEVGEEACALVGAYIKKNSIIPQLILCSTAIRTRETHALVMEAAGAKVETNFIDGLYLATAGEMLRFIHKTPTEVQSVMVIAHNPGTHNLALKLTREGNPDLIEHLEEKYPTCSLAVIEFNIDDWSKVEPATGTLAHFLTPKSLSS